MAINEVIMDKILMLRKEGHMGARGIYIGMRQQAPELGPMRYAYARNNRDRIILRYRRKLSANQAQGRLYGRNFQVGGVSNIYK